MIELNDSNILIISITERALSINNSDALLDRLKNVAAQNDKNIELDLAAVEIIDSSAIAMLVKFVQHLSGTRRTITMKNVRPEIMQTFKVLRLNAFFKFK